MILNNHSRAALVIAHPSHELRVHGWMQKARPRVFVLTDGSGREAQPQLASTTKTLEDVGAQTGSVYGRVSDRDIYNAFLRRDFSFFIGLAEELAERLLSPSNRLRGWRLSRGLQSNARCLPVAGRRGSRTCSATA